MLLTVVDERGQLVRRHHGSSRLCSQQPRQRQPAAQLKHALVLEQVSTRVQPAREVSAAAPHMTAGVHALVSTVAQRTAQLVATMSEREDRGRI